MMTWEDVLAAILFLATVVFAWASVYCLLLGLTNALIMYLALTLFAGLGLCLVGSR